ncbi:trypsin-like serine peptidase [Streptantibioticus rubrisoli]|uniref:Trypsin-like peptidase domain-containing protein n=1 Tax=Streptantibioticus rubrisoli TaxID=1387313 RepID=A0ABT1PCH7_9ACTN|nr:trypsin-like peptidase domain-containing protein [Streptantibioticus rubrisoli]MCQ4043077.1 trypsin-like peptidase domain-containing protein [Streptantibioticus rubrisoli]
MRNFRRARHGGTSRIRLRSWAIAALVACTFVTGGGVATASRLADAVPAADVLADPGVSHAVPVSQLAPQIGAVFNGGLNGAHHCTASVVNSPGGDLIVTAAHCLGSTSDVFVPGYHDGNAPYGVWRLRRIVVDAQWSAGSDQDHDVAFAVVEPLNGRTVQSVVGGYALGIDQGTDSPVTITGYPQATQTPITCTNRISAYSGTQLRIYCTGFTGGTSGSPWVVGSGMVIGVIGGYQQGGYTADISYSVAFGASVKSLYERAVSV